jgi:phosphoribosylamine--glycine ligase
MVHDGELRVLEFNVRFGDPETEALLYATRVDLLPLFRAIAVGERIARVDLLNASKAAVVVLAAEGYPDAPKKGAVIEGVAEASALDDVKVFCAGVTSESGPDGERLVVSGGRVLAVAGRGDSLADALGRAYAAVDKIKIAGAQLRRDIGASVR